MLCIIMDIFPKCSVCSDLVLPTTTVFLLLRGTIVNRTYRILKNLPGTWYVFNHFYKQYLVLLTMVPRNSGRGLRSNVNLGLLRSHVKRRTRARSP